MKPSSLPRSRRVGALLAAGLLATATLPAFAGPSAKEKLEKSILTPEPEPSRVHVLVNLDVSNAYITPRGLNVENQGVIFQPLVLIFWNLYNNPDGFINDVTLTTGVWNSIHTRESGAEPSHWNEIDPIGGLTVKFAKALSLDVFWSAFQSQTDSYETSNNLSVKLTYNDSFLERFSFNPYVEYWRELSDKATVVFDPATSEESYYFSIGLNPTYKFASIPLTISMPTFINLVGEDFYQRFDGSSGDSGLAVFSTQFKVSTPLSFIPKSYGNWTAYTSVQYYHLSNDGVLDGNQVLGADAAREEDLVQFHGGISVFF
jgi:hypothetical protein